MSPDKNAMYRAYLDFEALQTKNKAMATQAVDQRARNVASAQQANSKERQRHAAAVTLTNEQHQSAAATVELKTTRAIEALDQRLEALTRSASAKGAVATGGLTARGRPPAFSAAQALDSRLGELIESKRGVEHSLAQLMLQLEREAGHGKAAARDKVTWAILGAGLVLAIVAAANEVAAVGLIAAATFMQVRLGRGPSAFMNRRFEKRPILAADTRARSGLTRKLGGGYILAGMAITSMVGATLVDVVRLWPPLFCGLYGVILLISGYKRSAGNGIRIPTPQFADGYTQAPPGSGGGRGTSAPAPQAVETDERGNPLQWRPVLKHEWVDETLRDPERVFSAWLRKRVHERAGRKCEAVYYDPFRTEWKRCTSRSQESDHIYPHATGGRSTPANAQALCQKCNVQKGASVPTAAYIAALQNSRRGYFPGEESPTVRKA